MKRRNLRFATFLLPEWEEGFFRYWSISGGHLKSPTRGHPKLPQLALGCEPSIREIIRGTLRYLCHRGEGGRSERLEGPLRTTTIDLLPRGASQQEMAQRTGVDRKTFGRCARAAGALEANALRVAARDRTESLRWRWSRTARRAGRRRRPATSCVDRSAGGPQPQRRERPSRVGGSARLHAPSATRRNASPRS